MSKRPMILRPRWRLLLYRWRQKLPYRICVPWQREVAEDGPYMAWRWRGREWFKRPWPDGRTKETVLLYERLRTETGGDMAEMLRRLKAERAA